MIDEPIRVLYIEDSPQDEYFVRELLNEQFETEFEFHNVEDVKEGLDFLACEPVDVILFDVGDHSGFDDQVVYRIRQQAPDVPVIVMSDEQQVALVCDSDQSLAPDVLDKGGLDKDGLVRAIRFAIEKNELLTQLNRLKKTERHLAYHDCLTNLPNRYLFLDRLNQAITRSKRSGNKTALLFLDLDGFKRINDALGHSVGDELLTSIAKRLRKAVREIDTVARIGGDEFTVVLVDLQDDQDAAKIAQKIHRTMSKPFIINEQELFMTVSIGISFYPNDGLDVESLIRRADIAMYRAKSHGKNTFKLFNLSMDAKFFEDLTLENSLRRAVENEELVLHYQPFVNLETGVVTGAEALVRWNHPKFGLVPPVKFIPIAEETGLIVAIEKWVLNSACRQLSVWQDQGYSSFQVAVNLSAREFRGHNLVPMITGILGETGVAANSLCLEITESNVMQNVDNTIKILKKLKDIGINLSVDDFGTGYSSLNYLKRFPLDTLKVDRTFVQGIPDDRNDTAISTAIVVLGHSMGLRVVAEGVETAAQVAFLRSLECDQMQGFYFSKPVPADRLTELLQAETKLH